MTSNKAADDGAVVGTATGPTTAATADQTSALVRTEPSVPAVPVATGPLASDQGRTAIADTVVAKIAGLAAREVDGVHDLGGGTARAVGALRGRIPGGKTNLAQGVGVEVGERQAAIDLEIVADYGVAIADVAVAIRTHVIESVEQMTGLEVTEVNITVLDVYLGDDAEAEPEARVE